jgi:hypothetical protein
MIVRATWRQAMHAPLSTRNNALSRCSSLFPAAFSHSTLRSASTSEVQLLLPAWSTDKHVLLPAKARRLRRRRVDVVDAAIEGTPR